MSKNLYAAPWNKETFHGAKDELSKKDQEKIKAPTSKIKKKKKKEKEH